MSYDDLKVQRMIDWFFENYEDPAQHVPYDTGEGGYQYINGGPYHPSEVLRDEFPDFDENLIDKAVNKIVAYGWEWVKKGDY